MHRGEFLPGDQACERDEFAPTNRRHLGAGFANCWAFERRRAFDATTLWSEKLIVKLRSSHT